MGLDALITHDAEEPALLAVLDAVAQDPVLYGQYVIKGGLALRLAYGCPRYSRDIDFNAVTPTANEITAATQARLADFSMRLSQELVSAARRHDLSRMAISEAKESEEIPTLLAEIAYSGNASGERTIKFQLTLSEIICASQYHTYRGVSIHVASLEDIVAEKLKALLQQVTRESIRSVDVFDLWYCTQESPNPVDPHVVTQYVLEKRKQWSGMPPLEKVQFRRKSVVARAADEYEEIRGLLPDAYEFVPFRSAYECILRFVDQLDLPG